MLEWVMFLNLHADIAYAILWGDKDTYRLAFTLAGAASNFRQVLSHPHSVAFHTLEIWNLQKAEQVSLALLHSGGPEACQRALCSTLARSKSEGSLKEEGRNHWPESHQMALDVSFEPVLFSTSIISLSVSVITWLCTDISGHCRSWYLPFS